LKTQVLYDELELLGLISNGDETAFRKIFNHYSDRLYSYTLRITDNEELAEEIVMDAFMKIWSNRKDLCLVRQFDSYLYTIVRNQAFTAIKRKAHESSIINHLSLIKTEYENSTEDTVVYNECQHILSEAVNQLPSQQRLVYSLSRDEGLKYNEIAEQLNLSKNTVKAHLKKAVSSLRIVFTNYLVFTVWVYFSF